MKLSQGKAALLATAVGLVVAVPVVAVCLSLMAESSERSNDSPFGLGFPIVGAISLGFVLGWLVYRWSHDDRPPPPGGPGGRP